MPNWGMELTKAELRNLLLAVRDDGVDPDDLVNRIEAEKAEQAYYSRCEGLAAEAFEDAAHGDDREEFFSEEWNEGDCHVPGMGRCNDAGEPYGYM